MKIITQRFDGTKFWSGRPCHPSTTVGQVMENVKGLTAMIFVGDIVSRKNQIVGDIKQVIYCQK